MQVASSLSTRDEERLDELLEIAGGRNFDVALGVLHAVAVAPGLIAPSAWIPAILGKSSEPTGLEGDEVRELLDLLLTLYNHTLQNLSEGTTVLPPEDELERCVSFAAGYVEAALLDPSWVADDVKWTFVSGMAYLAGQHDLVAPSLLLKIETMPDPEETICEQMHGLIIEAYRTFAEARRVQATTMKVAVRSVPRVGRNDPCPCGSSKKYKHCCMHS